MDKINNNNIKNNNNNNNNNLDRKTDKNRNQIDNVINVIHYYLYI